MSGLIEIFTCASQGTPWNNQYIEGNRFEWFGFSIDISDIAPGYVTASAPWSQKVRIYRYNQATTEMEVVADITDHLKRSFFGQGVALSKTGNLRLVVSSYNYETSSCFVHIFKYLTNIDSWDQIGQDITGFAYSEVARNRRLLMSLVKYIIIALPILDGLWAQLLLDKVRSCWVVRYL